MEIADPRAFLASLDAESLRQLVQATRKIAGPWTQNRYDSRQWGREHYPGAFVPPRGVCQDDDGRYFTYASFIAETRWATLEEAQAGADALMVEEGWALTDEPIPSLGALR